MPKVVIDGIEVEVEPGTTILKAAQAVGIDIPAFCYHPYLKPAGICRMCLVEVEGVPKLMPACMTEVQDGWVIHTDSKEVREARKWLLDFLLVRHPLDCPICDQAGDCELQDFVFKYGAPEQRLFDERLTYPTQYLGPLIVHQMSRCVLCRRCVRFDREVVGGTSWGVYERGPDSIVGPYESEIYASRYTCNMEELCPVGAITTAIYRYKTRIWKLDFTPSICTHCEVGCHLSLGVRENQLLKIKHMVSPYPSPWSCDKGFYGFEYVNHPERIRYPLVREDNKMRAISWGEMKKLITDRLSQIAPEVAAIVSPSLSCEDYLLMARFMKDVLGSELMDYRVDGSRTYPERSSIRDLKEIEAASSIFVVGEDVGIYHPVLALSIAHACMDNNATLFLLNSADTYLYKFAKYHLNPLPGFQTKVLEALYQAIKGEEISEELLVGSGVELEFLKNVASDIRERSPLIIGGCRLTPRERSVLRQMAQVFNVALLFLDYGANPKGAYGMGFYHTEGIGIEEILKDVVKGKIKGLFISCADLFKEYPHRELVKEALSSVEFLLVHDLFFTETASYADYFVPATSFAEDGGSMVNMLWSLQQKEKAIDPQGECRALWRVVMELSKEMGKGIGTYDSAHELKNEVEESLKIERKAPELDTLSYNLPPGKVPALFEAPFYRSGIYADWCPAFVQLEPEPFVALYPDDAEEIGLKEGDKALVETNGFKYQMRVKLMDEVPKGGALISTAFSDFPITSMLKGEWVTRVNISKIGE